MSSTATPVGPSTRSSQASDSDESDISDDASDVGRSWSWPRLRLGTIIVALVAIAFALRLWELGERPFHHDESLDAWWSWLFRNGRYERYDPVYHGPLRFYITAGLYEIFGESEAVARLFSALTGTAAVGLPWFLRRELGRVGTIAAAVGLCVSPTMLYYSRFGREDAQMVFLTLLAAVLALAYLRRPRTSVAAGFMFTLAASFAIKESTYLFGLILAVYALVVVAAQFDAQQRYALGRQSDPDELNPGFFGGAIAFAAVGLTITVVLGAFADDLFLMLTLFGVAMVGFTVIAALPRLRQARPKWDPQHVVFSVLAVAGLIAVVAVLRFVGPTGVASGVDGEEVRQYDFEHFGAGGWAAMILAALLMIVGLGGLMFFAAEDDNRGSRWIFGATLGAGTLLALNELLEFEPQRALFAIGAFIVAAALTTLIYARPRVTNPRFEWPPLIRAVGAIGLGGWAIAAAVFVMTWLVCFTIFFTVPRDWASGFTRAIDYWDSQQEVNRGGQPWYYYFFALPIYEWLFVILAMVGTWRTLRRPTIAKGAFLWLAIGSFILYSYAGERMPWLIAHPLLPLLILAGWGTQVLWENRQRPFMQVVATLVVFGLLATTGISLRASFPQGADGREILSQAGQATPHLTAALERIDNIDRIARLNGDEAATLAIGTANAWPYNWYLRNRPNTEWFSAETGPSTEPAPDMIIIDYASANPANYPDYQSTLFAMRSWWVPTYTEAGPRDWLRYLRTTEVWQQQAGVSYGDATTPPPEVDADGKPVETPVPPSTQRLRSATDRAGSWVMDFVGGSGVVHPALAADAPLRNGCGSVDQWFMVHNQYALTEQQAYPGPIERMGPLECAGDLVSG